MTAYTMSEIQHLQRQNSTAMLLASNRDVYIIWNPESEKPPRYAYATAEEAWRAAESLARRFPMQRFFVMHSQGHACTTQPVVRVLPSPAVVPIPAKLRSRAVRPKTTAKKTPAKRKTAKKGGSR